MTPALKEYADFLDGYATFLESMAQDQKDRYSALISFDAESLSHAMAGLQSGVMQLEQMEQHRIELQHKAGFGDASFAEILQKLDASDRPRMEELFRRTRIAVWDIKFLNDKALSFAQQGVNSIRTERIDPQNNLYAPPAKNGAKKNAAASSAVFEAQY